MIPPRQLWRMLHIQRVLLKHGLDELVYAAHLFRPVARLRRIPGFGIRKASRDLPLGVRIREALVELGPIFVKFGQALSTRRDLLPREIAVELAKLQDRVPPFPAAETHRQLAAAYRQPLESLFARFDDEPLAAASIAQVHTAALPDGREAIVKVLRPGVREQIRRDVDVLHSLAALAERYWGEVRRLRPREVVREFDTTLMDELDLMREAANASQLRRNFENSPLLYVPEVYWDWCRPGVLVMERIHGINIGQTAELHAAGIDMRRLAANGVEIFFTQVFRHNFFHADMHPGNIFVNPDEPAQPQYIAVDFGIVASLNPRDQQYLAENFLAFFNRDYQRVARLHVESGWVAPGTRVEEVESAFRTVCEPIFNRPLKDISFGQFLVRLFTVARRFDMEVQPQLILLQKTLLNIEGLGRELYPDLDLWETAQPILEEWMRERVSGRAIVDRLREQLPEVGETIQEFPQVIHAILQRAAEGRLQVEVKHPGIEVLRAELHADRQQRWTTGAGGATFVGGVLWLGLDVSPVAPGWLLLVLGAGLLAFGRLGRPA
ncbi:ubiquinone biosynthesis regulatory protein kinase UbiB [Wenzhouxiangella sp. XN24]|uniref:ubiquinone biosynthesis regulatory protein kinase UbiB n=1 Tax=Wenzhouxiangella sp. XN24 TaxID=2713569 RepID=UPI0013ED8E18|nr:ubiquinone biosynthesis regulatory protein kinase UbiB [Wenzhouxiangella sp. XN24]